MKPIFITLLKIIAAFLLALAVWFPFDGIMWRSDSHASSGTEAPIQAVGQSHLGSVPFDFVSPMTGKLNMSAEAVVVISAGVVAWLLVLAAALSRNDLDPVTRLTWVLVVILVPVFGVLLYWVVAPKRPPEELPDYSKSATSCIQCRTVIPSGETVCPKCGWSYEIQ